MNNIVLLSKLDSETIDGIKLIIDRLNTIIENLDVIKNIDRGFLCINGYDIHAEAGICVNASLGTVCDCLCVNSKYHYQRINLIKEITINWCYENSPDSLSTHVSDGVEFIHVVGYFISGYKEYNSNTNLYHNPKRIDYAIYLRNQLIAVLNENTENV